MLLLTLVLYFFGLVMVTSATSGNTLLSEGDAWVYTRKQLMWGVIGFIGMLIALRIPMNVVREGRRVVLGAGVILLFAVFVPGLGQTANGATRWLAIGPFTMQPSEIVKLGVVLMVAHTLSVQRPPRDWKQFALGPGGMAFGLSAVIFIQRDLGSAMVVSAVALAMYVVCGTRWRILLSPVGLALGLVVLGIATEPFRRERFMAFVDPWADPQGVGYQLVQGLIAIGSGGPFGVGLGHSVQKIHFLPEAHTDMIFAIVAEELGFAGVAIVVFCFAALAIVGLRIANQARDRFQALVAVGITATLCGQAVINLAGVVGVLPLTGVPLPLVSYGGSSLVIALTSLGLLANIAVSSSPVASSRARDTVARAGGGGRNGRTPGTGARRGRRAA